MTELTSIGKSVRQKDGRARVTGEARYYADFILPGMLRTRILRSPYPAADILSIDTTEAQAVPGVHLVMTHENYPTAFRKSLYYVGDLVAAVIADDETIAEEAMGLIRVEYEKKKFVASLEDAMKEGAPQVFEGVDNCQDWAFHAYLSDRDPETGLFKTKTPSDYNGFGDIDEGFEEADYIIDQKALKYAYCKGPAMEPRGCTADFDGTKLHVYTHSQGMHDEKLCLAQALGIPSSMVNYVAPFTGSSFGGKNAFPLDRNIASHYLMIAGLACLHLKKPVHCPYSREEEMVSGWSRGSRTDVKIGFKKDGTLTTMDMSHWQETGSGGDKYPAKNAMLATGAVLYSRNCKHLRGKIRYVNTNRQPAAGWQGYGAPEGTFAVETTMDIAAYELGIDPVELRKMNCMRAGDIDSGWDPLVYKSAFISSSGIRDCLDAGAEKLDWKNTWQHPKEKTGRIRHGMGVAIFAMGAGRPGPGNSSEAMVKIYPDGSAALVCAVADIGQGQHTVQCQIVAEVLGLPYKKIGLVCHDTDSTPFATLVANSCGTWIQGWATFEAAMDAKKQVLAMAAGVMGVAPAELELNEKGVRMINDPDRGVTFAEAFGARGHYGGIHEVTGYYVNNSPHPNGLKDGRSDQVFIPKEKGAQFISLDIDTETGMIENVLVTMAQNVGKALNPKIVAGQLSTSRHGVDNAMLGNDCIMDKRNGWLMTPNWVDYRHTTIMECDVDPIVIEKPGDPTHPFGATACGEGAACPTLAAFSNAIYNAIGVRLTQTPYTPESILIGLGKIEARGRKK
ncbi:MULTISPECIES: xanthine dehydrogenase family protein molybdopterin-binding subunit [unclassified Pseudodesulfovibrio]|uniref:xanthine dehydrogenase family protein molybdopterin-binding subunit n=1 Tax=unclassified Pseudodesulfovibrio TaxID=2661612 RepID=UPI0013E3016E|nr:MULTISPECIES: xanthine dehydrogenase family protein molybdopterin-binding subunit [unclassified Pseudodesulfovibrio]MCJ2164727.1 xanthine dehydrogenase family protein molybdopterin-binding subunit [Pseudodesulfovibrio sp. S3-i]